MAWIGCWKCSASVRDTDETCGKCGAALKGEARQALENPELLMVATTTPSIEGKRITAYKGIVASEAVIGANLFRDLFASIRDVVGGRSGSYEKVFGSARKTALVEMTRQAAALGANAVVGVDFDYEVLGEANGMLMVTASGTAVVVE